MSSHPARFLIVDGRHEEGESVELDAKEARHARVRRVERGERVVVFDGAGWSALAVIESANQRRVTARVLENLPALQGESPLDLTLALALLKSDRFEWTIERVVELGVKSIVPFASAHSLGRPSAARLERWREIAKSAVKQCGRSVVPRVAKPATFDEVVGVAGPRILFSERPPRGHLEDARARIGQTQRLTILIGPEGGFSPEEVEKGRATGSIIVGLGPRILRADTAAVSATALCQYLWGDLAGPGLPISG